MRKILAGNVLHIPLPLFEKKLTYPFNTVAENYILKRFNEDVQFNLRQYA